MRNSYQNKILLKKKSRVQDMTLKSKNGKHEEVLLLREMVQQTGPRTPSLSLGSSCESREM